MTRSSELARQKAAEAWCQEKTSHIEMQPALADAFAEILGEVWKQSWLGNATTGELLSELKTRAEVHGYADYRTVDG